MCIVYVVCTVRTVYTVKNKENSKIVGKESPPPGGDISQKSKEMMPRLLDMAEVLRQGFPPLFCQILWTLYECHKRDVVVCTYFEYKPPLCGEPVISLDSYTVPLVQCSTRLLPIMRDPGSMPRGTYVKTRFSC
jgi:hypothetical protein